VQLSATRRSIRADYLRIGEAVIWIEKARRAMPAHPNIRAYLAAACALNGKTFDIFVSPLGDEMTSINTNEAPQARLPRAGGSGQSRKA